MVSQDSPLLESAVKIGDIMPLSAPGSVSGGTAMKAAMGIALDEINAAGGINRNYSPGDLMLACSFNGIDIKKELTKLIGLPTNAVKNAFVNLSPIV